MTDIKDKKSGSVLDLFEEYVMNHPSAPSLPDNLNDPTTLRALGYTLVLTPYLFWGMHTAPDKTALLGMDGILRYDDNVQRDIKGALENEKNLHNVWLWLTDCAKTGCMPHLFLGAIISDILPDGTLKLVRVIDAENGWKDDFDAEHQRRDTQATKQALGTPTFKFRLKP